MIRNLPPLPLRPPQSPAQKFPVCTAAAVTAQSRLLSQTLRPTSAASSATSRTPSSSLLRLLTPLYLTWSYQSRPPCRHRGTRRLIRPAPWCRSGTPAAPLHPSTPRHLLSSRPPRPLLLTSAHSLTLRLARHRSTLSCRWRPVLRWSSRRYSSCRPSLCSWGASVTLCPSTRWSSSTETDLPVRPEQFLFIFFILSQF